MNTKIKNQIKTYFFFFFIPVALSPYIVGFNIAIFNSSLEFYPEFHIWWMIKFYSSLEFYPEYQIWRMIIIYNAMACVIVRKHNPNAPITWVIVLLHLLYNILNSSFGYIYISDINILSSVFYLIIFISFMFSYSTRLYYCPISLLRLGWFYPKQFFVSLGVFSTIVHCLSHNLVSRSIYYDFSYKGLIIHLFYTEPICVITVFFFFWFIDYRLNRYFGYEVYKILFYSHLILIEIKHNYSAQFLLEIFIVCTITYVHTVREFFVSMFII